MLLNASAYNSEIKKLEEKLLEAMRLRDLSFLTDIFSDTYVFIGSDGSTWNKDKVLEDFKNPKYELSKIEVYNRQIFMYDNTAIVTGISIINGRIDETPLTGRYQFTRVWNKEKDGWIIIAISTSEATN